jgi:hypothetical protein
MKAEDMNDAQYALECVLARLTEDDLRRTLPTLPQRVGEHLQATLPRGEKKMETTNYEGGMQNALQFFEEAGCTNDEARGHAAALFSALHQTRRLDTLAVMQRKFGLTDENILDAFKRQHIEWNGSAASLWETVKKSGIRPDAGTLVAALHEVDDSQRDDSADLGPFNTPF